MKKIGALFFFLLFLSGCSGTPKEIEKGMALRSSLLQGGGCSFTANVTADYGDRLYQFSVNCQGSPSGDLTFRVTKPDSIADISGTITNEGGNITFDALALYFDTMAEGQLAPISAPWIFLKALRSGYIASACTEEDLLRFTMNDSSQDNTLIVDIWTTSSAIPVRADILYEGMRILSLEIETFEIL